MSNVIQVFLGGMVGAILRFFLQSLSTTIGMLWTVNVTGSFLLGCFNGVYERRSSNHYKLFFTTGLLGAFTTFSTFTGEWFRLIKVNLLIGIIYGISMTVTCLIVALIGYQLFRGEKRWNG